MPDALRGQGHTAGFDVARKHQGKNNQRRGG